METEIIGSLATQHGVALLTEAFIPLVAILVLVGLYRIAHKFIPQLIFAIQEITKIVHEFSAQTQIMRDMLLEISKKIDVVENNTIDNSKRLDAIEITLKKVSEELAEIRIETKLKKGNNDVR